MAKINWYSTWTYSNQLSLKLHPLNDKSIVLAFALKWVAFVPFSKGKKEEKVEENEMENQIQNTGSISWPTYIILIHNQLWLIFVGHNKISMRFLLSLNMVHILFTPRIKWTHFCRIYLTRFTWDSNFCSY